MYENQKEIASTSYGNYAVKLINIDTDINEVVFTSHWHESYEFILVDKGSILCICGQENIIAEKNDLIVVSPHEIHAGFSQTGGARYRAIKFELSDILNDTPYEKEILKLLSDWHIKIKTPIRDDVAVKLFNNIADAFNRNNFAKPISEIGNACMFFSYLLDNYADYNPIIVTHDEKFDKILEYISNNYTKTISVSYLADKFGYNKSYLCRRFKSRTGLSVTNYVNLCRIEHAQNLLKNNSNSISEIASVCGFNSLAYFSDTFKRSVGMSPSEWMDLFSHNKKK